MSKFVVADTPQFTHPVEVQVPVDGGHEKQTFRATFNVLPTDKEAEHDLNTPEGSTSFLKAIVALMDDLEGADGKPLEYSDKVRDKLLALPFVRVALVRTYYAAIRKAAVGN